MQGALEALLVFMYQLEHPAVLLALLNVKGATTIGPKFRKHKYARVVELLQHVRTDTHFGTDMGTVIISMWNGRDHPNRKMFIASAKRLAGPQLGKSQKANVETACETVNLAPSLPPCRLTLPSCLGQEKQAKQKEGKSKQSEGKPA